MYKSLNGVKSETRLNGLGYNMLYTKRWFWVTKLHSGFAYRTRGNEAPRKVCCSRAALNPGQPANELSGPEPLFCILLFSLNRNFVLW